MAKLKGRLALVTGASSGIGEATAQRLAAAGYKVYGTSRRGSHAGERSFAMLPLDVTSDESVAAVVKEVIRLEGRIDLLVKQRGLRCSAGRSRREFARSGPVDLRYELLRGGSDAESRRGGSSKPPIHGRRSGEPPACWTPEFAKTCSSTPQRRRCQEPEPCS